MVGVTYFLALATMSIYAVGNIRYVVEMVAILAPLGPMLFVLLPRRIGGALALTVSMVLLLELHDVFVHNRQLPPDRVLQVPRDEQYAAFAGSSRRCLRRPTSST